MVKDKIMNDKSIDDKKILLHCCCAPCSTTCIERLIDEGYEIVLWFSNDNIYPESEYDKRFDNLLKLAQIHNLEVIKDDYNHQAWLEVVKGFENEREGAKRCGYCFDYNLNLAAKKAKELGIKHFTTTLTVSRYKNSERIFSIGNKYEGFEGKNFKKKNGYARSIELSKKFDLYRQHYCGCEFSLRDALKYQKEHQKIDKKD
jgi:predicted adenine nucleotide alpha hydrolase (AANH) superfamily ATPase